MLSKILGLILILQFSGCSLLNNVGGYDLSACEHNWDVCWQLYFDNIDKGASNG